MTARASRNLAKRLGCGLDVDRRHRTVTIHLPAGKQIPGNPGLDIRVNNCETMADAWLSTYDDLRDLAEFGMDDAEPS